MSETIIAFAWEPNGSKFAVLHGEAPRISVSFYHVKNNGKIELISKWPSREPTARGLVVAPGGHRCGVAGAARTQSGPSCWDCGSCPVSRATVLSPPLVAAAVCSGPGVVGHPRPLHLGVPVLRQLGCSVRLGW